MTEISGTVERLVAEEISKGSLHRGGLVDFCQGRDWQSYSEHLFREILEGLRQESEVISFRLQGLSLRYMESRL